MLRRIALAAQLSLLASTASAQDAISIDSIELDPPTVSAIGVRVLVSGDDDRDATATLRWRTGSGEWREGLPMMRVHPDALTGHAVPEQLAGSAIDLWPGTEHELSIEVVDPDGGGETLTITASTRPVPRAEPASPTHVRVTSASELRSALSGAAAGHVIELVAGTYAGPFSISASGSEDDPIVIRGSSTDAVILDGGGCADCNVLEVYGSFVHVEQLTIQSAVRGLRFQGEGATGNVVRRVHIRDVGHGIGSRPGQSGFYLCDNVVEGRLAWPLVYSDDGGVNADWQGIRVEGDGHVVCHNDISGFGDPLLDFTAGNRANDWYGNDVHEIYGDGIELDRAEGNVRCFRNRWTNVYTAISIQPALGGPVYVLRNVIVNVADEQLKIKMTGSEPSGVFVLHNTFVSPEVALNLQTPITIRDVTVINNLFVGPDTTARGFTVDFTPTLERVVFDGNGYYPDGRFWFGREGGSNLLWDSFAEVRAGGRFEASGALVGADVFEGGLAPPASYTEEVARATPFPAAGSAAIDRGLPLPGLGAPVGAGPDLGALERGCPAPAWGPRPIGVDETLPYRCGGPVLMEDGGVADRDAGPGADAGGARRDAASAADAGAGETGGGCGCRMVGGPASAWPLVPLALALVRRRR